MQDDDPETQGSASQPGHQEEAGATGRFESLEAEICLQFYGTYGRGSSDTSSRR